MIFFTALSGILGWFDICFFHHKKHDALSWFRATNGNGREFSALKDESMIPSVEFKSNWKQIISRLSAGAEMITCQLRLSNLGMVAKHKYKPADVHRFLDFSMIGVMLITKRYHSGGCVYMEWVTKKQNNLAKSVTEWILQEGKSAGDDHCFVVMYKKIWDLQKKSSREPEWTAVTETKPERWLPHLQANKTSDRSRHSHCPLSFKKAHREKMTARSFSPQGQWPHSPLWSFFLRVVHGLHFLPRKKKLKHWSFSRKKKTPSRLSRLLNKKRCRFSNRVLMISLFSTTLFEHLGVLEPNSICIRVWAGLNPLCGRG